MRSRSIRLVVVALAAAAVLATGLLAQASSTAEAGRPAVRLARLAGAKEVPGPGAEGGTGVATVIVHPSQGRLCFSIAVEGIELPAAAAHVHVGGPDVAGPVVVGLTPPDAMGSSAGCVSADPQLLTAIKRNPRAYYVNVHTTSFPDGAVRGQLHRP